MSKALRELLRRRPRFLGIFCLPWGHDYEVVRTRGETPARIYLACLTCGAETPGLVFDLPRPRPTH